MENKEGKSKSKNRRSRRSGSSRSGTEAGGDEQAAAAAASSTASTSSSRAGASSVRGEEAARFDERIAAKREGNKARKSAQLNQLEEDVAAKTRARGSAARSTRPGAALTQAEEEVVAKTRTSTSETVTKNTSSNETKQKETELFPDDGLNKSNLFDDDQMKKPDDQNYEFQTTFDGPGEDKLAGQPFDDQVGKEFDAPPESAPQTIAAHGISNEPDVEYGTYNGGNGHGFDDTLAVAVAVSPEEEDAFIPSAIEYEPDSKPPIYKNRRFRFYVIVAAVGLVAIGVGVAFGVTSSQNNASPAPTPAPTTLRETTTILPQLIAVVGETRLNDPESTHARAADWIINEDPIQLPQEADNLIQRFLLTLFYMSTTNSERQWLSCNPPVGAESSLCNFTKLAQVWPEVAYENITWSRWLSEEHECNWAGVFCDEFNQTRAIELPGQEIRGTFPSEIALMPYLQSLTFNWNEFYGTMPSELASMKHLLNIELHYNFFTGQVPPEWYEAQALQRINFAANYLSGTIPTQIGQLSTMKGFFSFENSIGGTIPTEVGKMKFLSFTRWGRNFMTGTLPSEVGNLEKLQEMWFHRNQFTGEMPSEMGNMRDLGDLRLHFNKFTGTVPVEHYNMPQLRRWDLYDCNLTSPISTHIGQMTNMETYRIRENNFFGTIPTEIGLLSGLNSLWLHRNDLTGEVPLKLCAHRGPTGISVLDADCGPTNGIGEPMIQCLMECCTACCDTVSGYCIRELAAN